MFIIPAIDIIDGKCVRLTQGDYAQKTTYASDPLEVAKGYEDIGLKRLHLVDLDGAKQKKVVNLNMLERIASQTSLQIDFGGGVQSDEDLKNVLEAGAQQVTAGSIAVREPEKVMEWLERFGADKIILGADVRGREIAVSGWQEGGGLSLMPFLEKYTQAGVQYAISTDVAKDGLLQGPSLELYADIREAFPELKLIASGGVAAMDDLVKLREAGCWGCIVGKAIYENRIGLKELADFNAKAIA